MSLIIVDYNAGNLRSVQRACIAAGVPQQISADPEAIVRAERIIFPGVGHAQTAMETLRERGLDQALSEALRRGIPILGICVGAQLILDSSEESAVPCLGWIPGQTRRFKFSDPALKVPHIGWNEVKPTQPHALLEGLRPGDEFYFVHSYYPHPADIARVFASSNYGGDFCCALGKDNLFATQFHPEKSGRLGLELLARFSRWEGSSC
jgi:imidazole glycerol-phosphate synthase subunit HisH